MSSLGPRAFESMSLDEGVGCDKLFARGGFRLGMGFTMTGGFVSPVCWLSIPERTGSEWLPRAVTSFLDSVAAAALVAFRPQRLLKCQSQMSILPLLPARCTQLTQSICCWHLHCPNRVSWFVDANTLQQGSGTGLVHPVEICHSMYRYTP